MVSKLVVKLLSNVTSLMKVSPYKPIGQKQPLKYEHIRVGNERCAVESSELVPTVDALDHGALSPPLTAWYLSPVSQKMNKLQSFRPLTTSTGSLAALLRTSPTDLAS